MSKIKTSRGEIVYREHHTQLDTHPMDHDTALKVLNIIANELDKAGISWGPAFGTLIGIVRNDDFLPWAHQIDLYILKEDEERFKDHLVYLLELGVKIDHYERSGMYGINLNGISILIYVMRKISYDIRHTGGRDFILDKYLTNTVKWEFKGIKLNIPIEVDEYLTFQYGDWLTPQKTITEHHSIWNKIKYITTNRIKKALPDSIYYPLILRYHKRHFKQFINTSKAKGVWGGQENVELSYSKPLKKRKILTVGVYDLIHKGHVELFRRARGLGGHLIVAVQDGDMILKFKPQAKVLNSTEDRLYMVKAIRYVDEVTTYKSVDEIVKEIDFDVFVSGPDQCHEGFQRAIKWCEENGKDFTILARTDGVSSSELKAKISAKQSKS